MTTRSKTYAASLKFFYDDVTGEILDLLFPVTFVDDFDGVAVDQPQNRWGTKLVKTAGTPTVAAVTNAHQVALALDATSEKQEATLYFSDQLDFSLTKSPIVDINAALSVLPSATGVEAVWGLMHTWIDGPDNNAAFARFRCTASGELYVETYDGTTLIQADTGIALVAGAFHDFRIDAFDPTNVVFLLDGDGVAKGSVFEIAATGAAAEVQPYLGVYKPSGTGVATLTADFVKIGSNR